MQKVSDEQIISAISNLSKRGYPPSVREIGETVGLSSSSTVHSRLSKLRQQGLIEWEPTQVRTLRVVHHV